MDSFRIAERLDFDAKGREDEDSTFTCGIFWSQDFVLIRDLPYKDSSLLIFQ